MSQTQRSWETEEDFHTRVRVEEDRQIVREWAERAYTEKVLPLLGELTPAQKKTIKRLVVAGADHAAVYLDPLLKVVKGVSIEEVGRPGNVCFILRIGRSTDPDYYFTERWGQFFIGPKGGLTWYARRPGADPLRDLKQFRGFRELHKAWVQ